MPNPYQSEVSQGLSSTGLGSTSLRETSVTSLTSPDGSQIDDGSSAGILENESDQVIPQPPRQWAALTPSGLGSQELAACSDTEVPRQLEVCQLDSPRVSLQIRGSPAAAVASEDSDFRAFSNLCRQIEELHHREVGALVEENAMLQAEIQRLGGKTLKGPALLGRPLVISKKNGEKTSSSSAPRGAFSEQGSLDSGIGSSTLTTYGAQSVEGKNPQTSSRRLASRPSKAIGLGGNTELLNTGDFTLRDEWLVGQEEMLRMATRSFLGVSESIFSFNKRPSAGAASYTMEELKNRSVPLHPEQGYRLTWDFLAAVLLAYDTVMLPLYLFEIESQGATKVLDWLTAIFWTLDIPASLCTGAFIKGRLEMSYGKVFRQYAKTWLVPDVSMVAVEWLLLCIVLEDDDSALSSVGAVRNMRILRFVRLARLVKFERLISQVTRRINSVYLLLSLRIIRMVLAILVANHILASTWYAIGVSGWVRKKNLDTSNVLYCYLTAFHWSLTQFHGSMEISPKNLKERLFAVLVLLTALVAFSWFLSSMTNSMIMLQNIHQERTSQQRCLLGFLLQRNISQSLAVRIKEYIHTFHKENQAIIQQKEVALLHVLPKGLLLDLHAEMRGAVVTEHPLFEHINDLYTHFIRQLMNEGVEELYASRKDTIFFTGEACTRMLFINSQMNYFPGHLRQGTLLDREFNQISSASSWGRSVTTALGDGNVKLANGCWVSEPVLWTTWVNCGSLTALEDAYLYALKVEIFLRQMLVYEEVRLDAIVYAKAFLSFLNSVSPSDLPDRVDAHQVWAYVLKSTEESSKKTSVISAPDRYQLPTSPLPWKWNKPALKKSMSNISLGSKRSSVRRESTIRESIRRQSLQMGE